MWIAYGEDEEDDDGDGDGIVHLENGKWPKIGVIMDEGKAYFFPREAYEVVC